MHTFIKLSILITITIIVINAKVCTGSNEADTNAVCTKSIYQSITN